MIETPTEPETATSPITPPTNEPQRPQFGLRGMFWFTTGMAAVFAVLGTLGVDMLDLTVAFGSTIMAAGIAIFLIQIAWDSMGR